LEELRTLNSIKEAGEWITADDIRNKFGVSNTINRKIESFESISELRKSRNGNVYRYYPPWVMEEFNKMKIPPAAGDWVNLQQISQALGNRSAPWVAARLEELGISSELRMVNNTKLPTPHYPPAAITILRESD